MKGLILGIALVLIASAAEAQVRNPRSVSFLCPTADHALDTGHELDILDSFGKVIQTIQLGDPAAGAAGTLPDGTPAVTVVATLNVQPVTFGTYTAVVRSTFAGGIKSDASPASAPWQRAPGPPGQPTMGTTPTARVKEQ